MDDKTQSTTGAVLRFRLPLMLLVTAVAAVGAAVAAPYYRGQPAGSQTSLLIYWSTLLIFAGVGLRHHWRVMTTHPPNMGSVRLVLPPPGRASGPLAPIAVAMLGIATNTTLVVVFSSLVAAESVGGESPRLWFAPLMGATSGFMVGQSLLLFLKTPTFLCDNGITFLRGYAPWKSIHYARWRSGSRDVLLFHQLVGDIPVTIPAHDRDAVEAFVRAKTTLLEQSQATNDKPPACAGG